MGETVATVAAAIGVFVGTDIDDLIVLTVLFLAARSGPGRPRTGPIWAGQYAGVAVLVAVSMIAALGLTFVPDRWVGLLGLVPFALGVNGLITAVRARSGPEPSAVTLPVTAAAAPAATSVAALTIANGADNISVYTPMFRTLGRGDTLITIVVFAVGVTLWCAVASWLGSHQRVIAIVERSGHWIVPGVFVVVGAVIVLDSGILSRLASG